MENNTKLPAGSKGPHIPPPPPRTFSHSILPEPSDKSIKRQLSTVVRRLSTTAKRGVTRLSLVRAKTFKKVTNTNISAVEDEHHGPSSHRRPHVVYDSPDAPPPPRPAGEGGSSVENEKLGVRDRMGGRGVRVISQRLTKKD
ncbi:hypothetical protein Dda_9261 [Drechslerella dactyloides]|uniref:Uncharacterized protein n=1 Tax=Drechslerella dactyloides TaxID=74499 RepID=A0AAD6NGQ4_DREDA|nr:hypothetical protein Dda_9261 [Drechslerella dactyloides]